MRLVFAELLILDAGLALAAHAQTIPPPAGPINVTNFMTETGTALQAKGDAIWGVTDCTPTTGNIVVCASHGFTSADRNKAFILDDRSAPACRSSPR